MIVDASIRIKVASVLLAFVNVFLLTMYYRPESVVEVFVLATTIVSFVISVMYLATDQYLKTYTVRKFDAGIHSIMGIIMLCVSTVFLLIIEQNDLKCYHDSCLETHAFRILCGVFGVIVGVLYGIIGILLTSEKQVGGYEEI